MNKLEGKNGITATVIKDSVAENSGNRITTFELEYPRFIHSQVLTHRAFSKNASSSRAVPLEKAADHVKNNMAIPIHFGSRQSGMQAHHEMFGWRKKIAKGLWVALGHTAVFTAKTLAKLGSHKQWAARILEPWQMMKVVLTGTEFENFYWLRDGDAQPELQELARVMQEAQLKSSPDTLKAGEWHLPYIETVVGDEGVAYIVNGVEVDLDVAKRVSASCNAQVSFRRLDQSTDKAERVYNTLVSAEKIHASPFEHIATPMDIPEITFGSPSVKKAMRQKGVTHADTEGNLWSSNICGWVQLRNLIPNNVKRGRM